MLIFLATACKKDNNVEPIVFDHFPGKVTGFKNGVAWEGDMRHFRSNADAGISWFMGIQDTASVQLNIRNLLLEKRNFPLVDSRSLTNFSLPSIDLYFGSSDAIIGTYYLLEKDSVEDYIELTNVDINARLVSGHFQASFAKDTFLSDSPFFDVYPDTLVFEDCQFQTKIF